MSTIGTDRGLDIGAEPLASGGVRFRVWAPARERVEAVIESPGVSGDGRSIPLEPEDDGYFAGWAAGIGPGALYRYRLDGKDELFPDPASRYQPSGPHGPSLVVDPSRFEWTDFGWGGPAPDRQVIYELHVGTFTAAGTWSAAMVELPVLADTGITTVELMPIAEFDGGFGWGYDGVDLFAPSHLYGSPDDLRRFVDRAHSLEIAVILDVVYNHLGPSGNYLARFSPHYFSDRYQNDWGDPLNFDGPSSLPVRGFFLQNAEYWIRDFHLDGLRFDATQQIFDASSVHILAEIAERVRRVAGSRRTLLVAENEPQETRFLRSPTEGGYGFDGLWNDDFHHSAVVALTGRNEAYYGDYLGTPQELISSVKYGFLYQGQRSTWQEGRRGTVAFDIPPRRFVNFIENHDQVANSSTGARLHTRSGPGMYRAITALLLLGPGTPMLFQGQEFGATAPFLYFADHDPELAEQVRRGREQSLEQFRSLARSGRENRLADPADPDTFLRCKLDHSERARHPQAYALHRDLLHLRRDDPVFRIGGVGGVDGATLTPEAFLIRFFGGGTGERLLIVNLGRDLALRPAPQPLLAPPPAHRWEVLWSSEHSAYGGSGVGEVESDDGWVIQGNAAVVLAPCRDLPPKGATPERSTSIATNREGTSRERGHLRQAE
ncbi:MAG: malto-oligosyltrehalose trehalohydrolase [Gemmatimonas sp.]|nr:malto-oligosyltrehalose trehalohydrolase [Gemmatimonas sp.]